MTVKRHQLVANFEARSVALIAGWTLAGAAMAQNVPPPAPVRNGKPVSTQFHQVDRNGDGQISRSEAATVPELEAAFDRLDTDRNGSLNAEEFAQGSKG
ncbi:EF-hand domain-containing protein [Hydrogenophaga sp.]|uniref:EF-hand domain-containing protein n=1 Tax=Hydrogenophaga sp. TaxID=1904254 RepID=UPI00286D9635|nr:EF-hand domain-containing protein [Hydrogenophaga sp.]